MPTESPPFATASPAYMPTEQPVTVTATNSSQYNPNENPQPTTLVNTASETEVQQTTPTILEVQQPEQTETVTATESEPNNESTSKKIIIQTPEESTPNNNSNETKKITL